MTTRNYINSILGVIIFAALFSCKEQYVENPVTLPTVKTAKVETVKASDEPIPVFASGKISASENMNLSFKTGGIIRKIHVEVGQKIVKGQLLATLNTSEIDAMVNQAVANVEKLERDLGRYQRLYKDSAATLQSVQDIQTGLDVAKSELVIARYNQSYSKIVAPVSGKIQLKMAEENELVNPGQPIILISSDKEGMSLKVGLSDKDVVLINSGDTAKISFDAYSDLSGTAYVSEIAAEGDPVTGTFEVELIIDNFPRQLKSGFFARAEIFPSQQTPYYKIPSHALVSASEKEVTVFVPKNGKAASLKLKMGRIANDYFTTPAVDIQDSISVLTDGVAYLNEGEEFQSFINKTEVR
ncbi:MAG: efflux RND transporter periplasmic adaptor subunit [Bacteroidota bacterium]